jgi:hypothetical protein
MITPNGLILPLEIALPQLEKILHNFTRMSIPITGAADVFHNLFFFIVSF